MPHLHERVHGVFDQARPEHHPVRQGITGPDAQRERVGPEGESPIAAPCRQGTAQGNQGGGTSARVQELPAGTQSVEMLGHLRSGLV